MSGYKSPDIRLPRALWETTGPDPRPETAPTSPPIRVASSQKAADPISATIAAIRAEHARHMRAQA